MKKNILVFPCGSEIGLEVYRSVNNSAHFKLIGASSVDDHGKFVFENYIGNVPLVSSEEFIPEMKKIVEKNKIDAVFPAMDLVIEVLKSNESKLGCKVVSSNAETAKICLSKSLTYKALSGKVKTPKTYGKIDDVNKYPVFVKPDIGYGSRGAKKCGTRLELEAQLKSIPDLLISEYLPGEEYTVDCFTDFKGELLCALPRVRSRIMNGISVSTKPVYDNGEFSDFASKINSSIEFSGAWFFQVKRDEKGMLTLLEIASRFGGSSSLFRARGFNFALMSLYNAFDIPVSVLPNDYEVEMDRALDNKYKIGISYSEVFVDFDDCIYLDKKNVNARLMEYLFKCRNDGIKITLLSKHDDEKLGKLDELLEKLRVRQIFDRVIHIGKEEEKYKYIDNKNAIFIDDSFSERRAAKEHCGLNVFSLDMVESLV